MDFILLEEQLLQNLQFQLETQPNQNLTSGGKTLKNICTSILPACIHVYHVYHLGFLGTEIRGRCELWKQPVRPAVFFNY